MVPVYSFGRYVIKIYIGKISLDLSQNCIMADISRALVQFEISQSWNGDLKIPESRSSKKKLNYLEEIAEPQAVS